jgi:hypothetical protein
MTALVPLNYAGDRTPVHQGRTAALRSHSLTHSPLPCHMSHWLSCFWLCCLLTGCKCALKTPSCIYH